MIKNIKLTGEEKELIKEVESWKYKRIKNFESEKLRFQKIAKNTITKKQAVSIRLFEADIRKLKVKSIKEWIPYQTLISSVIHKFANDSLTVS